MILNYLLGISCHWPKYDFSVKYYQNPNFYAVISKMPKLKKQKINFFILQYLQAFFLISEKTHF